MKKATILILICLLFIGCVEETPKCFHLTDISYTCENKMESEELIINPIGSSKVNCCFRNPILINGIYKLNETCIGGEIKYIRVNRSWNGKYCQEIK